MPIVFVTAAGDETVRSRLLARAVECLFEQVTDE